MHTILSIILIFFLLLIVYHDFTTFRIPVYALGISLVIGLVKLFHATGFESAIQFSGINFIAVLLITGVSLLTLFLMRKGDKPELFNLIGGGDLFFFAILVISFSPVNFIAFFIASVFLALIVKLCFFRKEPGVPLAGGQAVALIITQVCSALGLFNIYSDSWILNKIIGG